MGVCSLVVRRAGRRKRAADCGAAGAGGPGTVPGPPAPLCVARGRHFFAARSLEREVEPQDVHAGLADEAQGAALGVLLDQFLDRGHGQVVLHGDPVDLEFGVGRGDVGVQAGAGGGDGVRGHLGRLDGVAGHGVVLHHGGLGLLDLPEQHLAVRGEVGRAGDGQPVPGVDRVLPEAVRGAWLEVPEAVALLADQGRAGDLAVGLDLRAVRLVVEESLGDAGDDERVEDAGQQGQCQEGPQARSEHSGGVREGVGHGDQPIPGTRERIRSMTLMPMKGCDQAAQAVDPEVAAEHPVRAHRPVPHALQGQRHQRDDDQRVEDDGGQDRGGPARTAA